METDFHLPTAVGTLFGFIGGLHLVLGLTGLSRGFGVLPLLLALWGATALAGVALAATGRLPLERAYTGGILLLGLSLLGYVDVYGTGVLETLPGIEWKTGLVPTHEHTAAGGHEHGAHDHGSEASSSSLLGQLASDEVALLSKIGEVAALCLLVVLKRE